ncbi:DNA ligase [Thiomicrospira sp. WB1]|uniref:DNA ligase n=1 Tax=Thiomicrospira sp. WB1 TaxID=1685380 RepID=UPI000A7EE3C6|nr:DNA ligase [Thiomicrospira sp. WB1]
MKWGVCLLWLASVAMADPPPNLFLLETYPPERLKALSPDKPVADFALTGWWLSEKYDGMRAYWDGEKLLSRQGNVIHAPDWFTEQWPSFALDGELWLERQAFAETMSIVRQTEPDERWRQVTFQVFDVPNAPGGLTQRLARLTRFLTQAPSISSLSVVKQIQLKDSAHFKQLFSRLQEKGAEGAVVRAPNQSYLSGRSDQALKVKLHQEAECQVQGYQPGRGRLEGMVGSLRCEPHSDSGFDSRFSVGSGLTDAQRKTPPKVGAWITFKYYGRTRHGKPRFPVFMRVRPDFP